MVVGLLGFGCGAMISASAFFSLRHLMQVQALSVASQINHVAGFVRIQRPLVFQ
jgi:hypothetical protein